MLRNVLTAGIAVTALAFAAPTLAKPGGGAGAGAGANVNAGARGPSQTGIDARVNSQGSINASPQGVLRSNTNSAVQGTTTTTTPTVRAPNSQGLLHANPRAISRANSNSVLARGAVPSASLPGLTTNMTVNNSTGATIGTVSQVITGSDGSIRAVVVTSPTGQTFRLAPSTLSISGGVLVTTSTTGG